MYGVFDEVYSMNIQWLEKENDSNFLIFENCFVLTFNTDTLKSHCQ